MLSTKYSSSTSRVNIVCLHFKLATSALCNFLFCGELREGSKADMLSLTGHAGIAHIIICLSIFFVQLIQDTARQLVPLYQFFYFQKTLVPDTM